MNERIDPDVHQLIRTIRGHRVILDADLARTTAFPLSGLTKRSSGTGDAFQRTSFSNSPPKSMSL